MGRMYAYNSKPRDIGYSRFTSPPPPPPSPPLIPLKRSLAICSLLEWHTSLSLAYCLATIHHVTSLCLCLTLVVWPVLLRNGECDIS